jgi:hypothetical protein
VKARADVDTADFRRHLHSPMFAEIIERLVTLSDAVSHKITFTLDVPLNQQLMAYRGGAEPFDALIELQWSHGAHLPALSDSAEFNDIVRELDDYQSQFVDFSASTRFFVED